MPTSRKQHPVCKKSHQKNPTGSHVLYYLPIYIKIQNHGYKIYLDREKCSKPNTIVIIKLPILLQNNTSIVSKAVFEIL